MNLQDKNPTETPRQYFDRLIAEKMEGYAHVKLAAGQYTIGAFMSACMSITDEEDAAAFYEGLVESARDLPDLSGTPEDLARSNIGWCFGEGMAPAIREMWVRACDASHPVFGQVMPSSAEAFERGVQMGSAQS